MESNIHHDVIRSIRNSHATVIPHKGGFVALVVFTKFNDAIERLISDCFNAFTDHDNFCIAVSNNLGLPLIFNTEAEAGSACVGFHSGLEKKYTFYCYLTHQFKIHVPEEVTVSFYKRGARA